MRKRKRRILAVTGSRSEYDVIYSTLKAIKEHPNLHLKLVVANLHFVDEYGYSVNEILADGFDIQRKIECFQGSGNNYRRTKGLVSELSGLTDAVNELGPDMILVAGDREEAICAAIVGGYMGVPVAHMYGGDRAFGSIDNCTRHATSKYASLHFTLHEDHTERLIKMGEDDWRIFTTGHGGLDRILTTSELSDEEMCSEVGLDIAKKPLVLVIQHVLSSESDMAGKQMDETLMALSEFGCSTLIGYPNGDVGSDKMIEVIEKYTKRNSLMRCYRNLSRGVFTSLLKKVDVLVGNSSCGIFEMPLLRKPVLNVGNRQGNRVLAENVLLLPLNKEIIKEKLNYVLYDERFKKTLSSCRSPYGDGKTGERVADILSEVKINDQLVVKHITY